MNKGVLGIATIALASIATSAHANHDPYADPYGNSYRESSASVSGPYAGVQLGYQEVATIDLPTIGGNGTELNVDGATIGGYLGYNIPLGDTVVVGVEGGANFGTDQLDNDYTISGHLGFVTGENSMIFFRRWIPVC